MKDFLECFFEEIVDRFFAIMKFIISILIYGGLVLFISGVVVAVFETPFWLTFLVIALIPVGVAALVFLWSVGEMIYWSLWWKKRR